MRMDLKMRGGHVPIAHPVHELESEERCTPTGGQYMDVSALGLQEGLAGVPGAVKGQRKVEGVDAVDPERQGNGSSRLDDDAVGSSGSVDGLEVSKTVSQYREDRAIEVADETLGLNSQAFCRAHRSEGESAVSAIVQKEIDGVDSP